jgi:hypothetical protein
MLWTDQQLLRVLVLQTAVTALQHLLEEHNTPDKYMKFMTDNQVKIFVDYTNINTAANTCMLNRTHQSNRPVLDVSNMITRVAAGRHIDSIVVAGSILEQDYAREKRILENLNIHGTCLLHLIPGEAKEHTVDQSIIGSMYHSLDMYPDTRDAQTIILLTGDGNCNGNAGPNSSTARWVSLWYCCI